MNVITWIKCDNCSIEESSQIKYSKYALATAIKKAYPEWIFDETKNMMFCCKECESQAKTL